MKEGLGKYNFKKDVYIKLIYCVKDFFFLNKVF